MLTAVDILALKAAQKRLVRRAGGQEACTLIPGMRLKRHQSFHDFGNPDLADRHMPIDVLATLERDAGPEVTRVLAQLTGHMLVPVPQGFASGSALGRVTAEALKETAEVFTAAAVAMADGRMERAEAETLGREVYEAIVKLVTLKLQAEAEADGEGGA